jgi:hypothetical protein
MNLPRWIVGGFLPTRSLLQEIRHGQDVTVAGVKHNDSTATSVVLLYGSIKMTLCNFLDSQINRQPYILPVITGYIVITIDPQRATKRIAQRLDAAVNRSKFFIEGELNASLPSVLKANFANQLIR